MGLETGRAWETRRQKWWPGGRVALYECGAVTPVHTKRMRGCPGWKDGQQEHRQSDALTAHKTSPAANGRAGSAFDVCDLPPHLLGASPQIQFSPHPSPFTTLTLTHMTTRHQPHTLSAAAQERTPAVGGNRGLGEAAAPAAGTQCGSSCPPSLAAAADSDLSTPMLTHDG